VPGHAAGPGVAEGSAAAVLWPMLFGDLPMEAWPAADAPAADGPPWSAFVSARTHWADGDQDLAIRDWASVSMADAWESRHALQAWHFLRAAGVQPDASIASQVHGVVAEIAVDGSHDALAAYRVGGVRYLNHAGGVSVVDDGPPELNDAVVAFIAVAQAVADRIGPWTEAEPPPLPSDHSRFTMLTPSGPRLGQGPDAAFRGDPMAGPLFEAATRLLMVVVDLSTGPSAAQ
jgi:hypothetical protein